MGNRIYVYTTRDGDYDRIFKEGICFLSSDFSMAKEFHEVADTDELSKYLLSIKSGMNAFIIEIPEEYLTVTHRDFSRIFPYPLLFERQMFDPQSKVVDYYPVLVPSVIKYMYRETLGFIANENYNTGFNPNGLKYTKEQLESIKEFARRYYSDYVKRNNEDSMDLYSRDTENNTWNQLKQVYGDDGIVSPFPLGELPDVTFESSKEKKKKLNNNKGKKKKRQFFEE